MDTSALTIRIADPADAAALLHVIHQAFAARPAVDPPAEALTDEVADIERALTVGFGVVVEREGHIIAGLLVDIVDGTATLRRVSVLPSASGQGVARSLVEGALTVAADLGARRASLFARQEFPQLVDYYIRLKEQTERVKASLS